MRRWTVARFVVCWLLWGGDDRAAVRCPGLPECGYTDMRKGMQGLAMLVQQVLAEDPFNGALYAFRGRRGNLLKLVWHDGIGLCMLTKRLERGHFIWPMTSTGSVALSTGQLSTLLEGCEWRATARNLRPELAG
jgi:transposase